MPGPMYCTIAVGFVFNQPDLPAQQDGQQIIFDLHTTSSHLQKMSRF